MSHKCPYDIYRHKHDFHRLKFFHTYLHKLVWQPCMVTNVKKFIILKFFYFAPPEIFVYKLMFYIIKQGCRKLLLKYRVGRHYVSSEGRLGDLINRDPKTGWAIAHPAHPAPTPLYIIKVFKFPG